MCSHLSDLPRVSLDDFSSYSWGARGLSGPVPAPGKGRVACAQRCKADGVRTTDLSPSPDRGASMTTNPPVDKTESDRHRRSRVARAGHWVLPVKLPPPKNPALLEHAEHRAENAQNRIADRITTFAGSMAFVYIHIIWFGCWIGFGVEKYPFGLLTMIVSLEAIFLSTFVMISQNRAEAKRQVLADEQWRTVREEDGQNKRLLTLSGEQDHQNNELLGVSNQILELTKEGRSFAREAAGRTGN
jgi:low affinity Fe/Cu permease